MASHTSTYRVTQELAVMPHQWVIHVLTGIIQWSLEKTTGASAMARFKSRKQLLTWPKLQCPQSAIIAKSDIQSAWKMTEQIFKGHSHYQLVMSPIVSPEISGAVQRATQELPDPLEIFWCPSPGGFGAYKKLPCKHSHCPSPPRIPSLNSGGPSPGLTGRIGRCSQFHDLSMEEPKLWCICLREQQRNPVSAETLH